MEATEVIAAGARIAEFVDEIFVPLAGGDFSGTAAITVDAPGAFAAIALEQGPGVFTTLPVNPLQGP